MKVEIENRLQFASSEAKEELNYIIELLLLSADKEDAKMFMRRFEDSKNFEYGFSGNHMWLHQKINGKTSTIRVLIVYFN